MYIPCRPRMWATSCCGHSYGDRLPGASASGHSARARTKLAAHGGAPWHAPPSWRHGSARAAGACSSSHACAARRGGGRAACGERSASCSTRRRCGGPSSRSGACGRRARCCMSGRGPARRGRSAYTSRRPSGGWSSNPVSSPFVVVCVFEECGSGGCCGSPRHPYFK